MNKIWQQVIAAKLLSVYSLAIWLFCCHGYDLHESKKDQQKQSAEKFHAAISTGFTGYALQPSNFSNAGSNNAHSPLKNSLNEFSFLLRITDQLILSSFSQISFHSIKMRISQHRTDIIFPFHNFW